MATIARDTLAGTSCPDSLSPLNTPRVAKTWPSAASTMSALGVGSITSPPPTGNVAMQYATYPAGTMMIEASTAATTWVRRGWNAAADRQYLRTRCGPSCRGSDPNRDAVLIACILSAGAAGLPIRDDAERRGGKYQSPPEGLHCSGHVSWCLS